MHSEEGSGEYLRNRLMVARRVSASVGMGDILAADSSIFILETRAHFSLQFAHHFGCSIVPKQRLAPTSSAETQSLPLDRVWVSAIPTLERIYSGDVFQPFSFGACMLFLIVHCEKGARLWASADEVGRGQSLCFGTRERSQNELERIEEKTRSCFQDKNTGNLQNIFHPYTVFWRCCSTFFVSSMHVFDRTLRERRESGGQSLCFGTRERPK